MACQVKGPDPGRSWAHLEKRSLLLTLRYPAATICLRQKVTFCRLSSCSPSYPDAEALELLQCRPDLSSCAPPPCSWMSGLSEMWRLFLLLCRSFPGARKLAQPCPLLSSQYLVSKGTSEKLRNILPVPFSWSQTLNLHHILTSLLLQDLILLSSFRNALVFGFP